MQGFNPYIDKALEMANMVVPTKPGRQGIIIIIIIIRTTFHNHTWQTIKQAGSINVDMSHYSLKRSQSQESSLQ